MGDQKSLISISLHSGKVDLILAIKIILIIPSLYQIYLNSPSVLYHLHIL